MVGYRSVHHPLLPLRLERPLPQELVRGQAGFIGSCSGAIAFLKMWDEARRSMGKYVYRESGIRVMPIIADGGMIHIFDDTSTFLHSAHRAS